MPILRRLSVTIKALNELGPQALLLFGRYQLGLRSGYLRWKTPPPDPIRTATLRPLDFLLVPTGDNLRGLHGETDSLLEQAGEIANSRAHLFGGGPRSLLLELPGPLAHWTDFASGQAHHDVDDVKFIWEGGRFGWGITLARAYLLTGDDQHAETFWRLTERFLEANPPYNGPHWESAQEAAIRLISLLIAFQVFKETTATTPSRADSLAQSAAAHAERIPPTLVYARAQNNNHLLAEAAGLLTASAALPDHPNAATWKDLGWHWFNHGLQAQIAEDGSYVQQSANYHRLMLQIGLWGTAAARSQGLELPPRSQNKLIAATRWALDLVEPLTGELPNLGPNDGGQLLPLSSTPIEDHRPTLVAAARAFLNEAPFPRGPWDELGLWLGLGADQIKKDPVVSSRDYPHIVLTNGVSDSWAYLRVQEFNNRPGHADLLHLDLWLNGINVAQDAGTYLYNAGSPWNNSLAGTAAHNTVSIAGQDQMARAGRFLWLDWPNCKISTRQTRPDGTIEHAAAWHDGYRRLGVIHERYVKARPDGGWDVEDWLSPPDGREQQETVRARLHWLLQDWPYTIEEEGSAFRLTLQATLGKISLLLSGYDSQTELQLVRAGELLVGPGPANPIEGWVSPTYASKQAALSAALSVEGKLPIRLKSEWNFINNA